MTDDESLAVQSLWALKEKITFRCDIMFWEEEWWVLAEHPKKWWEISYHDKSLTKAVMKAINFIKENHLS